MTKSLARASASFLSVKEGVLEGLKKRASNTGLQYRRDQVVRGVQPPSAPPLPLTHTHTLAKYMILNFSAQSLRTDGRRKPPLYVHAVLSHFP